MALAADSLMEMIRERTLRKREKLLAALPISGELLRGTLLERIVRHKSGCPKCARIFDAFSNQSANIEWIDALGYPLLKLFEELSERSFCRRGFKSANEPLRDIAA